MRADMRDKITIKSITSSQNTYGEIEDTWTAVYSNLWASKEPLLGKEYFAAEGFQSGVEVKFRTYYVPGVINQMRVFDDEGEYEILSVINVKSLNRELLMYCRKVI